MLKTAAFSNMLFFNKNIKKIQIGKKTSYGDLALLAVLAVKVIRNLKTITMAFRGNNMLEIKLEIEMVYCKFRRL